MTTPNKKDAELLGSLRHFQITTDVEDEGSKHDCTPYQQTSHP